MSDSTHEKRLSWPTTGWIDGALKYAALFTALIYACGIAYLEGWCSAFGMRSIEVAERSSDILLAGGFVFFVVVAFPAMGFLMVRMARLIPPFKERSRVEWVIFGVLIGSITVCAEYSMLRRAMLLPPSVVYWNILADCIVIGLAFTPFSFRDILEKSAFFALYPLLGIILLSYQMGFTGANHPAASSPTQISVEQSLVPQLINAGLPFPEGKNVSGPVIIVYIGEHSYFVMPENRSHVVEIARDKVLMTVRNRPRVGLFQ